MVITAILDIFFAKCNGLNNADEALRHLPLFDMILGVGLPTFFRLLRQVPNFVECRSQILLVDVLCHD
jgi:hypothetical protein